MAIEMSMRTVEDVIAARRDQLLIGHEFMRRLDGEANVAALRRLLPRLAFFTFAFQDMLRLAREGCTDAVLTPIVRSLEDGDRGHDRWYVEDLKELGIGLLAHEIFGAEHEVGRRVTYALIGRIGSASSDHERLAILLTLESAAREFFLRVPGFAARAGLPNQLRYFGTTHLEAEEAHDVFAQDAQLALGTIAVPEPHRERVLQSVDASFALLVELAGDLASAMAGVKAGDQLGSQSAIPDG